MKSSKKLSSNEPTNFNIYRKKPVIYIVCKIHCVILRLAMHTDVRFSLNNLGSH